MKGVEELIILGGEIVGRTEAEVKVKKSGGELAIDWIWKLCNMLFEGSVGGL